jgi:hypothetical protein
MASNDNNRGKLLTAGGVLSIVAGIFQISSVVPIAVKSLVSSWPYGPSGLWEVAALWFLPFFPHEWCRKILWLFFPLNLTWGFILVGCVGVLGILAVVGGVSAIRRKRFGLSLAGTICALPSWILGILAVIFVALGKREFGAERKENGI